MIQTDFRFSQQRRDDVADRTMSLMLYLFERVRAHGAGGFLANKVLGLIGFDGPAREIARRRSHRSG